MNSAQATRCVWGLDWILLIGLEFLAGGGSVQGKTHGGIETEELPGINVWFYNLAKLPDDTLQRAERLATGIFRSAGVAVHWTNCKFPKDPECAGFLDAVHLGIRLLPDIQPAWCSSDGTLGYAVGDTATISLRRVSENAAKSGTMVQVVLARVLAHEIGHMLLGRQGHSSTGIMRAHWQSTDYHGANLRAFLFNPEQAGRIRSEIRKRWQGQDSLEMAVTSASH